MKILLINKFLYPMGGDAISTLITGKILSNNGHLISYWGMDHPNNGKFPLEDKFISYMDFNVSDTFIASTKKAINILYSFEAKRKISKIIEIVKPNIVHLNNIAHQISPSILSVIKNKQIPIVMTMRDYKIVCPSYSMLSKGEICERCKGGCFYHCGINRCTKGSILKSILNVAEMYLHHRVLHIYDKIDLYISPSLFLKTKVEEMGLKGEVVYLPNCVDVKGLDPSYEWKEQSIVYVGRLSHEKGVGTLLDAIKGVEQVRLKIIGEGPLKKYLEEKVRTENVGNVVFLGYLTGNDLNDEIRKSMFLVIPSECYENNPRTVIEAFSIGKPAVGARIGGIPELVRDWKTGLTYISRDAADLRKKILLMLENRDKIAQMGKNARAYVERELNAEVHYHDLMNIYRRAAQKAELQIY